MATVVKNPPAVIGDMRCGFDPWVRKVAWRREWQPTPVLLPGKVHGQRNLVGYSSGGHKDSDMTEHTCSNKVRSAISDGFQVKCCRNLILLYLCKHLNAIHLSKSYFTCTDLAKKLSYLQTYLSSLNSAKTLCPLPRHY